ncbi:carotenoid oxygenase family protein [Shewanella sp. 202IG2-18]|uniref:carotenoid oxygenase family protein n=1 Tax=Parashewanella hymeniacidonis TaxID=2807618 RepID=UPI001960E0A5|nr:carotenoid oxygenase family protein [Parashewanella hymeniacidonis]MBM7073279.1 carotenoid oxygenase family protein [Parashewanella hymeniacidonis]
MERRQLLKMAPAVGAGLIAAKPAFAVMAELSNIRQQSVSESFAQAKRLHPELIGFENVNDDFERKKLKVEGQIPKDLQGHYYRNGPAKLERNGIRYQHLFEGDGMLQHFCIAGGKVTHRGRFIHTPKFSQEEQAGRFVYSGPETKIANGKAVVSSNAINTANTNVIPVGNDLWALWEAGSATRINAQTLDYLEQVDLGKGTRYDAKLTGLPFSAHPKVEANGDIWNFGLHPSGSVVLYHLYPDGKVKNVGMIDSRYKGGMLHDFLITQKHILLILPSLKRNLFAKGDGYFSGIEFARHQTMKVLVIDKHDLTITRQYELPPGFVFHFGNAWEDKQGEIQFDMSLYANVDVLYQMSNLMTGDSVRDAARAETVLVTLKKSGEVSTAIGDHGTEFPRVFANEIGQKSEQLFYVSGNSDSLWSHSVNSLHYQTREISHYDYGRDYFVEEHVPIKTKAGGDYLMGTALHVPSKRTCLTVFNADNVAHGPVVKAWLPYHLPIGFHGSFISG